MPNVTALWARAQELLPGLRCKFCQASPVPANRSHETTCYYCPDPDLAMLLRAMGESGWAGGVFIATDDTGLKAADDGGFTAAFYLMGHCEYSPDYGHADHADPLTAALLAAVKALEAEKGVKDA